MPKGKTSKGKAKASKGKAKTSKGKAKASKGKPKRGRGKGKGKKTTRSRSRSKMALNKFYDVSTKTRNVTGTNLRVTKKTWTSKNKNGTTLKGTTYMLVGTNNKGNDMYKILSKDSYEELKKKYS